MKWPLCLALCLGCSATRHEADRALALGARTRELSLAAAQEAAAGLSALSCDDRDICRVKNACSKVALATVTGLEKRQALEKLQERPPADRESPEFQAEAEQLYQVATQKLLEGKNAVPECETALAILERAAKGK